MFSLASAKIICEQLDQIALNASVNLSPGNGTPLYGLYGYARSQGYVFSAALVINRVSILADFGHFGNK